MAAAVRSAAPSLPASSTALVISSTNKGMPSVRSTMSCLILAASELVADNAVDHRPDVALPEAVDRHECYMRSPYPGRIKVRPECHYQQHRKAADALDDPTERFQARWIGPMGILKDHQHRTLACQCLDL
jgi:hypothetical protein